jgi:amino-acid N-acetyltransferase
MQYFNTPSKAAVLQLLTNADLPTDDIDALDLRHFFGCGSGQQLMGLVGLELFGPVALLRSLAVANHARGTGCGKKLVAYVEDYARENGVSKLYLLTTTAEDFFAKLGYGTANRSEAPKAIAETREFSGICPGSAAFMVKRLD